MRISRRNDDARRAQKPAGEPVILFTVAGQLFAIAASAVDEIRPSEGMQTFGASTAHPRLSKVVATMERGARRCYVVQANTHFLLLPSRSTRILMLRGCDVAVAVDAIEKMSAIQAVLPLPQAFTGEERQWYRGLAAINDELVPVVEPAAFLSRAEIALLETALTASMSGAAKAVNS